MARESVHIPDHVRKIIRGAAFARRSPVTARVPGKNGDVCKREQIDCFLPPAGVLVAAMKEQYSLVGRFVRNPCAIEQLVAVPTLHRLLNGFHWFLPTLSRRDEFRCNWAHVDLACVA